MRSPVLLAFMLEITMNNLSEADRKQVGSRKNWVEYGVVGDMEGEFFENSVKF